MTILHVIVIFINNCLQSHHIRLYLVHPQITIEQIMMKYYNINISYQEVPDEISLTFYVPGCSLNCNGCHSPFLHDSTLGHELSITKYTELLESYKGLVSCILFMGGEWFDDLSEYLKLARDMGFKTCLYTGRTHINSYLSKHVTYLKTGPWIASMGGLDSPGTNQRFVDVESGELLNYKFNQGDHKSVHKTNRKTDTSEN